MAPDNRSTWQSGTGRSPLGLAGGAAVLVAATMVAAVLFPGPQVPARLLVVAAAVGGCAAALTDTRASLALAAIGYALFTGFLVNSRGELTWDGMTSVWHLLVLASATGLGRAHRWIHATQADLAFDAELRDLLGEAGAGGNDGQRHL